jgi:hypothetical protein
LRTCSWWTLAVLAACGAEPSESYVARDPCAPLALAAPAATAAEQAGIAGALALWRDRGVAAFDALGTAAASAPALGADAWPIEIRFDAAAAAFHGVYDPTAARVLINRDLGDPATVAIVIAHELGHVFGLAHVAADARISLMNPGNLITPPTEADQGALEARWGRCR